MQYLVTNFQSDRFTMIATNRSELDLISEMAGIKLELGADDMWHAIHSDFDCNFERRPTAATYITNVGTEIMRSKGIEMVLTPSKERAALLLKHANKNL